MDLLDINKRIFSNNPLGISKSIPLCKLFTKYRIILQAVPKIRFVVKRQYDRIALYRTDWSNGKPAKQYSRLRISSGTLAIVTQVFRGFT
jgi:hypothetical protein